MTATVSQMFLYSCSGPLCSLCPGFLYFVDRSDLWKPSLASKVPVHAHCQRLFPPFQFTIISFHKGSYHMQHLSAPGQKQLSCHTIWEESTSPMPQRATLQLQWLGISLRQSVEQVWYKFAQEPLKIKTWCLRSFVCAAPATWHKNHHWSLCGDYTTQSDRGAGHSSLSRRHFFFF